MVRLVAPGACLRSALSAPPARFRPILRLWAAAAAFTGSARPAQQWTPTRRFALGSDSASFCRQLVRLFR